MKVLLIGQDDRAEMRPIVDWLAERVTPDDLFRCPSFTAWLEMRRPDWHPDLVVVLESHPDEFTSADVGQLFSAAPLARIVCCAGAWSESAGRTRKIWPLALRVPAVHARSRLEREWNLLSGQRSDFHLPSTGSREEWFAAHYSAPIAHHSGWELTVQIESPDAAYRQMLTDLLIRLGLRVAADKSASVHAILWDADPWSQRRAEELQRLAAIGPVIALSDWATSNLQQELLRGGAHAVVSKLGDQTQLWECLWTAAIAAAEP